MIGAVVSLLMKNAVMKKITGGLLRKVVNSRFARRFAGRANYRVKKKYGKLPVKKTPNPLTIKNRVELLDDLQLNFDLYSPEYIEKVIRYLDQVERMVRVKKKIDNVKKVIRIYNEITNPQNALMNRFEKKVLDLIFGKHKKFKKEDFDWTDNKSIIEFEKRLVDFKKNETDVKKFNKMMDATNEGTSIALGLDSSWLLWGVYTPLPELKNFGNVVLKLNPAKCASLRNPSLIYYYGLGYKDPPMHFSVWKKMITSPNAGTTYWRRYKKVFSKFETREMYYDKYKKTKVSPTVSYADKKKRKK